MSWALKGKYWFLGAVVPQKVTAAGVMGSGIMDGDGWRGLRSLGADTHASFVCLTVVSILNINLTFKMCNSVALKVSVLFSSDSSPTSVFLVLALPVWTTTPSLNRNLVG